MNYSQNTIHRQVSTQQEQTGSLQKTAWEQSSMQTVKTKREKNPGVHFCSRLEISQAARYATVWRGTLLATRSPSTSKKTCPDLQHSSTWKWSWVFWSPERKAVGNLSTTGINTITLDEYNHFDAYTPTFVLSWLVRHIPLNSTELVPSCCAVGLRIIVKVCLEPWVILC